MIDKGLIQSCQQIMANRPEITHVLLLTGDADFRELAGGLVHLGKSATIICQWEKFIKN